MAESWGLIPSKLFDLIKNFILFKRSNSDSDSDSDSNSDLEYVNMDGMQMIERLFYTPAHYIKLNKDLLSYDETELGAFISVSMFTPFIHRGKLHRPGGIYITRINGRFDNSSKMECRYMTVHPMQNTEENGYGKEGSGNVNGRYLSIWAKFYEIEYFPLYSEVKDNDRFHKLYNDCYIDTLVYKKRIRILAELFLKEANYRANKIGKLAFCRIIGLGTGTWKIYEIQTYVVVLNELVFNGLSDVYFSLSSEIELPNTINNIKIHTGNIDPFEPLSDPNKLLVIIRASDPCSSLDNDDNNDDNNYILENLEKVHYF